MESWVRLRISEIFPADVSSKDLVLFGLRRPRRGFVCGGRLLPRTPRLPRLAVLPKLPLDAFKSIPSSPAEEWPDRSMEASTSDENELVRRGGLRDSPAKLPLLAILVGGPSSDECPD